MLSLVPLSTPAAALDVVNDDHGGRVEPYAARVAAADARGEPVRFGNVECDSSCTLLLAARNACVSPNTVFGFHAPWYGEPTHGVVDPRMTAMFARHYKPALRRLFLEHVRATGGAAPGPLLRLSGAQLAGLGYRVCGAGDTAQRTPARVRQTARDNGFGRINPNTQAYSPQYFFGPLGW